MDTFSKLGWFFKAHRKRYALGITALVDFGSQPGPAADPGHDG